MDRLDEIKRRTKNAAKRESWERHSNFTNCAFEDIPYLIKELEKAESEARTYYERSRKAAEIIIAEIGAVGIENGDEAALRIVAKFKEVTEQLRIAEIYRTCERCGGPCPGCL